MLDYSERYPVLNDTFLLGKDSCIEDTKLTIRFLNFDSKSDAKGKNKSVRKEDNTILENSAFQYPVFMPAKQTKHDKAILLLHGLNERSWNKYLSWAEFLAVETGQPVILFPLAFHMNRAPVSWSNPRALIHELNARRSQFADERTISFANIALSNRLSERPDRFYLSGRQSLLDVIQLFETIKEGRNPFFKEGAEVNIFAYSIGAFLAQIALMDNRSKLFSNSRLFMFCGGSIFSAMSGVSRSIMDMPAFKKLQQYYNDIFDKEFKIFGNKDSILTAFQRMLRPDSYKSEREAFFASARSRMSGVALAKDTVIPYHGVMDALGSQNAMEIFSLQDFSFNYTHETPFPVNGKDKSALNQSFKDVFSKAASFLS